MLSLRLRSSAITVCAFASAAGRDSWANMAFCFRATLSLCRSVTWPRTLRLKCTVQRFHSVFGNTELGFPPKAGYPFKSVDRRKDVASSTTPSPKSRRTFDPQFKREAVELSRKIGVRQAAEDLGITESNLRNWKKQVDRHGSEAFLPSAERTDLEAENRRLRRELDIAREERDILKGGGLLCEGAVMRYRFIHAHRDQWSVRRMCKLLRVGKSSFQRSTSRTVAVMSVINATLK